MSLFYDDLITAGFWVLAFPNPHGTTANGGSMRRRQGYLCPHRARRARATVNSAKIGHFSVVIKERHPSSFLYWPNNGTHPPMSFYSVDGSIVKMPLHGGPPVTLASGLHLPEFIASDEARLYWVNRGGAESSDSIMALAK